ncbi:hypothetical protein RHA1_ro10408 (plasmid) [Rhodococcus jostii RHA1]|uniref:Uncharacterized protein n=1 Tax=Rhodococcus jostii (strain RHA1) TaxID=101510 RepID=Q0RVT9_RHOJR|nr:hypothetical protein RHA1_ro10408 [Rhodococcus jostii RHA1]
MRLARYARVVESHEAMLRSTGRGLLRAPRIVNAGCEDRRTIVCGPFVVAPPTHSHRVRRAGAWSNPIHRSKDPASCRYSAQNRCIERPGAHAIAGPADSCNNLLIAKMTHAPCTGRTMDVASDWIRSAVSRTIINAGSGVSHTSEEKCATPTTPNLPTSSGKGSSHTFENLACPGRSRFRCSRLPP